MASADAVAGPDPNQLLLQSVIESSATANNPNQATLRNAKTTPLTPEENAQQAWKHQKNSKYENVLYPYLKAKEARPIHDDEFRDLQSNILNSGQIFRFLKPRYRFFVTFNSKTARDLPFGLPRLPPIYPISPRAKLAHLLMAPVGLISDFAPAKISKFKTKPRGGTVGFLRSQDKNGVFIGYQLTDSAGAHVTESLVWLEDGNTADILMSKARAAHTRFVTETSAKKEQHLRDLHEWGQEQRLWEWELFRRARAFYGHVVWPKGRDAEGKTTRPSKQEIQQLSYQEAISHQLITVARGGTVAAMRPAELEAVSGRDEVARADLSPFPRAPSPTLSMSSDVSMDDAPDFPEWTFSLSRDNLLDFLDQSVEQFGDFANVAEARRKARMYWWRQFPGARDDLLDFIEGYFGDTDSMTLDSREAENEWWATRAEAYPFDDGSSDEDEDEDKEKQGDIPPPDNSGLHDDWEFKMNRVNLRRFIHTRSSELKDPLEKIRRQRNARETWWGNFPVARENLDDYILDHAVTSGDIGKVETEWWASNEHAAGA